MPHAARPTCYQLITQMPRFEIVTGRASKNIYSDWDSNAICGRLWVTEMMIHMYVLRISVYQTDTFIPPDASVEANIVHRVQFIRVEAVARCRKCTTINVGTCIHV
jgi:hypothetical protein